MKKTAFLAILVLSLAASAAYADAVSCGPEQSSGSTYYDYDYGSQTSFCHTESATVYAYKNCTDQFGNACTITWNENYTIYYTATYDPPIWDCIENRSAWVSNTNVVDPCQ